MQETPPHSGSMEDGLGSLSRQLQECQDTCATLQAECERLKLIMDNAPVLLAYLDTEHHYRFINAAYSLRFGGHQDEVLGQQVSTILGEKLWAEIKPYRERVVAGESLEYEVDVEVRPGEPQRMHCVLTPARARDGKVVGYVVAITDITDRRRVAEARDLLAAIVESSDDAIVSMTLDGRVTSWNAGATRLFGYSLQEVTGQMPFCLTTPDEQRTLLQKIAAGERVSRHETVCFAKDGRRLDISLSAAPMRNHTGRIVGIAKVARDITEAKAAEDELKRSQAALREADRRKDEFLALLAHELRNPLAPLLNALELLRSTSTDPTVNRLREMMKRQVTQLQRLVDDLLDVSRISRGRFELRRDPLDLSEAIHAAVEASDSLIAARGHTISIDMPPEVLRVEGDFARLAQVFTNLLSNSAKYTEPGGSIHVSLRRENPDAIVSIRDSGIGIPRESFDEIFDMFSQVKAHERHAGGGLGIGLALVRSLVQMHGGSVEVESEGPGTGSTFTIRLPLMDAPVSELGGSAELAPHPQASATKRILIADDNDDAASSLASILQMQGHEIAIASDGRQAVELAESFRPDVIFMDLGMPVCDGLEATRRIRSQPWGKSVFIVALTGWGQMRDRIRTREGGMDLHLVKPISLEAITTVVGRV